MRPKSIILLVLALGCGLIASIGISQVMDSQKSSGKLETVPIYVALNDINVGDSITPEMVKIEDWPKDKVPQFALADLEKIKGQRPRVKLFAGEPIVEPKLGGDGIPTTTIPDGFRCVAVTGNKDELGAGLLTPGDRVDVQLNVTRNRDQGIFEPRTQVILTNIRVFAVDQQYDRSNDTGEKHIASVVSLLVTPDQANRLDLAQKLGEVRLILRHPDDMDETVSGPITVSDLLGDDATSNNVREERKSADLVPRQPSMMSGLVKMLQQAAASRAQPATANPVPQWRMQIIEGDAVRNEFFDDQGKLVTPSGLTGSGAQNSPGTGITLPDPNSGGETDEPKKENSSDKDLPVEQGVEGVL